MYHIHISIIINTLLVLLLIFLTNFSVRSAQNFKNASFYLTFIYCFFNAFSFFNIDPSF